MAQPYIKQLIFSWLRMVHRKITLQQYALNQRSPAEGKGKGQKLLAQGNTLGKLERKQIAL